jgi:hypothetical protein
MADQDQRNAQPRSGIRMTLRGLSERAAVDRRKCWAAVCNRRNADPVKISTLREDRHLRAAPIPQASLAPVHPVVRIARVRGHACRRVRPCEWRLLAAGWVQPHAIPWQRRWIPNPFHQRRLQQAIAALR